MDISPEFGAVLCQAFILIGQVLRVTSRAEDAQRRLRDVQSTLRSLPCLYPRADLLPTICPSESALQSPTEPG